MLVIDYGNKSSQCSDIPRDCDIFLGNTSLNQQTGAIRSRECRRFARVQDWRQGLKFSFGYQLKSTQ